MSDVMAGVEARTTASRERAIGGFQSFTLMRMAGRAVQTGSACAGSAHTLRATAHRDFTILELTALNHLFQTCTTGEAYEYPVIEETFAPIALDSIRSWLDARFRPAAT
jgi:hypothetical protein